MFYPYSNRLREATKSFNKGNFSLWFNKLIPLNNETKCKPCDKNGKDKEAVQYYESVYNGLKNNPILKNLLEEKQKSQQKFCEMYEKAGYELINFKAELISPLITGIGQTHPNEVGMVFDHTIGIPYIPASSVKGIVRFVHMLELIKSDNLSDYTDSDKDGEFIVESNLKTLIPAIFGGDAGEEKEGEKKLKGKVIFLDAYPNKVPDMHVDIMNPHYGQYYSDDKNKIPPADYLDPTTIKFLTVKPRTVFTFKALVSQDSDFLFKPVQKAFKNAFENEGLGAKTAVGYGRFKVSGADGEQEVIKGKKETMAATPLPDPQKQRRERLAIFQKGMPKPQDLPGQIGVLIEKIKDQEDETLKREMTGKLFSLASSDGKRFKKARNKGKPWVEKLVRLCREVGIEI